MQEEQQIILLTEDYIRPIISLKMVIFKRFGIPIIGSNFDKTTMSIISNNRYEQTKNTPYGIGRNDHFGIFFC